MILSGSNNLRKLITTDCQIDELTDGILILDHKVEIGDELCRIIHGISVITTTVEGDSHLPILHLRDVLDGAGLELERHNQKKSKGLSEVF